MPNIRTNRLDITGIVREVNDKSGQVIGQAVAELGGQVAGLGEEVMRLETRRDTSRLTKEAAEAQTELMKKWDATIRSADPNDKEVASRFMDEVFNPTMEALGADQGMTGRAKAHLQQLQVGMRSHFDKKTFGDSVELIGLAAENNFKTMVNELSTQASIDFENVDTYISMARQQEEVFIANGGSRETVLRMQEETDKAIALGAINGYIDDDPMAAKADLDRGVFGDMLSGAQQKQLSKYAQNLQDSRDADARQANNRNAHLASSNILERLILGENSEALLKDLATERAFDTAEGAADQRILYNLLQSNIASKKAGSGSPKRIQSTYDEALRRATLPLGDPDRMDRHELMKLNGHGLTQGDVTFLMDEVEAATTPEGKAHTQQVQRYFSDIKNLFIGGDMNPTKNEINYLRHQEFTEAAQRVISQERAAGKTDFDIFDPVNGTLAKMLPAYTVTRAETRTSRNARRAVQRGTAEGGSTPRKPDESVADYLKRTGK